MKKAALGLFLLLVLSTAVFALGDNEDSAKAQNGLNVVATTSIIGDVVKQVLQDNGKLAVLLPVGQNPHSYSPTPRDIALVESADIIFVNGLDLEEELMPIIENLSGPVVIEVSRGLAAEAEDAHQDDDEHDREEDGDHQDDEDDHQHHAGNPHFWFSPLKVVHWVHEIEESLAEIDPENAGAYKEAAEDYEAKLLALDAEIRELVKRVAPKDRKLVMDHDSYEYFADDYGFTILANLLPSISDTAEPSARHIAKVVEIIEKYDIKAIFVGETAGQNVMKLAESAADELKRPLPVVSLLNGSLTASGRGADYLDFVRYNTEQIVKALTR
jgi:ABC-type Zn uptake system ZnuABC Zn-binding protein ZnuA